MAVFSQDHANHFLYLLDQYQSALPLTKELKRKKLLSQADILASSEEGLQLLYEQIPVLSENGLFDDTVWASPKGLVPSLISGTLLGSYPSNIFEVLSELRLLALSKGDLKMENIEQSWAIDFLKEAIVENFDLAYEDFKHPRWGVYQPSDLKKIKTLFSFLLQYVPLDSLKKKLLNEIETLTAHRPIVTNKVEQIIIAVHDHIDLDPAEDTDRRLMVFTEIFFRYPPGKWEHLFAKWGSRKLKMECERCGKDMAETGLVSQFHLALLQHITKEKSDLIPRCLSLNPHGIAEFNRHKEDVVSIIQEFITLANRQSVYGLRKVLERSLLSRKLIFHALERLKSINIHPEIAERLVIGNMSGYEATPKQLLMGGIYALLGQPLGVRQGNNPTCQSARALSMWSRHDPGKLINMLIDAASTNNIIFRYEGDLIESAEVLQGVADRIDFKLDYVSIVLVPHLDRIYNEMMKRASMSHIGKDPHISVNPAFYGHWIQTGFVSAYDPLVASIVNYEDFVGIFYASYHPEYNGGHSLAYPVPLGIFITDTTGKMRGFHAISLLRVQKDAKEEWRCYFFNPNSEGPQDWGLGIRPTVASNGELAGESSLPFAEFVSRVYAYHYNQLQLGDKHIHIPQEIITNVKRLAKESWGRSYNWK